MRLFIIVFLAVATAISANALYMQEAPRLAGSTVREPPPNAAAEVAAPAAALMKQAPLIPEAVAATGPQSETAEPRRPEPEARPRRQAAPAPERLVKAIQRELADRGYADGPVTGTLDIETRASIIAYEFDEHMPLTGEAGEPLLKSLIFGRALGKAGPGPAGRFEEHGALIAEVQSLLSRMGYASGPADGRLDEATREATRRFESDHNLAAQGRLTERVLLEMVIVAGRPLNTSG